MSGIKLFFGRWSRKICFKVINCTENLTFGYKAGVRPIVSGFKIMRLLIAIFYGDCNRISPAMNKNKTAQPTDRRAVGGIDERTHPNIDL